MVEERNKARNREEEIRSKSAHEIERMKAKLAKSKYMEGQYKKMTATVIAQRDVAWNRADQLQVENAELIHHLATADHMTAQYRDIAFDLYYQLHPPLGEGEGDSGGELADGGETDEDLGDGEDEASKDDDPMDHQDDNNDDPGYGSDNTD